MVECAQLPVLVAMHAPDGLFSMPVNVVFGVVVLALIGGACARLSRRRDHRLVPLMGLLAAFVFAGQMVNFPIASGTTGHLLGGTLAAILAGPWAATIIMAAVVVFQALLGDGGITVLGPNIFNMGVVGTCMAYFIYRAFVGRAFDRPARVVAASFFAAWVSVPLASVFASLQLAVSGTVSLSRALPAMVLTHMLIGIGEALITAGVVAFVLKTRPDLLYGRSVAEGRRVGRPALAFGLSASLVIATCLSLLPRLWDYPDGLEYVCAALAPTAGTAPPLVALLPDYTVPGLSGVISTSAAGAIGTVVMFVLALVIGRVLMRSPSLPVAGD